MGNCFSEATQIEKYRCPEYVPSGFMCLRCGAVQLPGSKYCAECKCNNCSNPKKEYKLPYCDYCKCSTYKCNKIGKYYGNIAKTFLVCYEHYQKVMASIKLEDQKKQKWLRDHPEHAAISFLHKL